VKQSAWLNARNRFVLIWRPLLENPLAQAESPDVFDRIPPSERVPAPWVIGLAFVPFGLVIGFTITALPFLLTSRGVSLGQVASMSAVVMSPTFWGFLLQPLMDTGLSRRTYSWLTAILAAGCLATALPLLAALHLAAATALLVIAELSMVLFSGAISGWSVGFIPDKLRGRVSGWTNVANLGGGALGSLAVMSLAPHVGLHRIGMGLAVCILLGATPTLFFPRPRKSAFRFRQIFTEALRESWHASRSKRCLIGFALFLAPASAAAAINLFSGLGRDFHTSEQAVTWITGAGCAISTSIGALIGGYVADRVSRGSLYLLAGMATGCVSLALALTPHTYVAFLLGALAYNGIAGVVYAAFNALGYQLVGQKSAVASTQLGLFSASTNLAIVYMTWADGQGYQLFHVRGLFLTDGIATIVSAALLLTFLGRYLTHSGMREEAAPETRQPV
jgi:MFS family permease